MGVYKNYLAYGSPTHGYLYIQHWVMNMYAKFGKNYYSFLFLWVPAFSIDKFYDLRGMKLELRTPGG